MPDYITLYLAKLECFSYVRPDLQNLNLLMHKHLMTFCLDTIDSLNKREFELDAIWIIKERILKENRGGLCVFLNGAFCHLLQVLQFDAHLVSVHVRAYNSRVFSYDRESHAAIVVDIDGVSYLVDVGFGDSFRVPLPIEPTSHFSEGSFKIGKDVATSRWQLEKWCEEKWYTQYDFKIEKRELGSFMECINYVYSPAHDFSSNLIFNKPCEAGYKFLINRKFTRFFSADLKKEEEIESLEALAAVIRNEFGVDDAVVDRFIRGCAQRI